MQQLKLIDSIVTYVNAGQDPQVNWVTGLLSQNAHQTWDQAFEKGPSSQPFYCNRQPLVNGLIQTLGSVVHASAILSL